MILAIEIDDMKKEAFLKFCKEYNAKVLEEIAIEDLIWMKNHNSEYEEYFSEEELESVLKNLELELK